MKTMDDHIFTIENPKTGDWRTFRIRLQSLDAVFAPGRQILGLLHGPENTHQFTNFAFVSAEGFVNVFRAKRSEASEPSEYETLAKLVQGVLRSKGEVTGVNVLEAIPCRRCGELLTRPQSIRQGAGPVCINRL